MNILNKLIAKLIGKKIGDKLGLAKTKVIAIVGVLVYAYNHLSPQFGWAALPSDILELLAALGLWTLRDAVEPKSA